mmetsp:Transcript_4280/g.7832  ORF Transcript_4280/g.7832 Transcript_4280/m.7832 type:complete len:109 (-) Transcript_4280:402-728(-)
MAPYHHTSQKASKKSKAPLSALCITTARKTHLLRWGLTVEAEARSYEDIIVDLIRLLVVNLITLACMMIITFLCGCSADIEPSDYTKQTCANANTKADESYQCTHFYL